VVTASAAPAAPVVQHSIEERDRRSHQVAVQTKALAEHFVNARFSDLDQGTITRTRPRMLDVIGCVIGGTPASSNTELTRIASSAPLEGRRRPPSSGMHLGFRPADGDAQCRLIGSYNSLTMCMTALALSKYGHKSGREFPTGLTTGLTNYVEVNDCMRDFMNHAGMLSNWTTTAHRQY
jgi:hypothetical protein